MTSGNSCYIRRDALSGSPQAWDGLEHSQAGDYPSLSGHRRMLASTKRLSTNPTRRFVTLAAGSAARSSGRALPPPTPTTLRRPLLIHPYSLRLTSPSPSRFCLPGNAMSLATSTSLPVPIGLQHVNLSVPEGSLALAQEFYGDVLGLQNDPVPHLQKDVLLWYVCAFSVWLCPSLSPAFLVLPSAAAVHRLPTHFAHSVRVPPASRTPTDRPCRLSHVRSQLTPGSASGPARNKSTSHSSATPCLLCTSRADTRASPSPTLKR